MAGRKSSIKTCSVQGLIALTKALAATQAGQEQMRRNLIFAAGVADNRRLLEDLGSFESSRWYLGRMAADPSFESPYL